MPVITLPDGSQRSFDNPVSVHAVAADIGPGLAKAALGGVVDGREVVIVRGKPIPLYYLKRWLIRGYVGTGEDGQSGHVVVVSVGTQSVGFVVDQLIGQEEVVIKPLGEMLQGTDGMAGATITGDGRIALILDVPSLLKAHAA